MLKPFVLENFAKPDGSQGTNISKLENIPVYDRFNNYLDEKFPKYGQLGELKPSITPHLICGQPVPLAEKNLQAVENFRKAFYEIISSSSWKEQFQSQSEFSSVPETESLLTAFDFHQLENGELRLIEVNTNASLLLPIWFLYSITGTPVPDEFKPDRFLSAFHRVHSQISKSELEKIFIFDEDPPLEGLYFEFLLNKEFFEQHNIQCEIIGTSDIETTDFSNSLVYNRHTDFFFEKPELKKIKEAYLNSKATISPHPVGYQTMAQKTLMSFLRKELGKQSPSLAQMIPESFLFSQKEKSEVWALRKNLFFKPTSLFGSKGVYSGKGISRKKFDEIWEQDYLAQELCPPNKIDIEVNGEMQSMKYDLRFYITPFEILMGGARVYQGQATNARTLGGGLSPLTIKP